MATPAQSKEWVLQNRPIEMPILGNGADATFKLVTVPTPTPKDGQVLLKTVYIGNDPAQRAWISDMATSQMFYVPPVAIGAPMRARSIAEVIESRATSLPRGTMVIATTNWTEYCVRDAKECTTLPELPGVSITHHIGALGIAGLTAYYGLVEIVKLAKSDTIVVSGAAGATGGMVIQLAKKILGCKKIIGIAGTDAKCAMVERLGADRCLNYKSPAFEEDLIAATSEMVDVFFDNVAGPILDLMLLRMNRQGRIAQCGAVAQYNKMSEPIVLKNYLEIISRRVSILGFVVFDYLPQAPKIMEIFKRAIQDGTLELTNENETVIETDFEGIPDLWLKMFSGINTGKLITKVTRPNMAARM